jgi:DNA helicase HerA-like ATPase
MSKIDTFLKHINDGYACQGDYIELGSAILDGETIPDARVRIPLKTMNRHGLIAGATGTGKNKNTAGYFGTAF